MPLPNDDISIRAARHSDDLDDARQLFAEYAQSLDIDLAFQGFASELAELPGKYAPPHGALLLARNAAGTALGCAAMRPLETPGDCEMKRLFVRQQARGMDLGRKLATAIIACAREAGYARIMLDTLASMTAAHQLYASLGFHEIPPYYDNPLSGVRYLALKL